MISICQYTGNFSRRDLLDTVAIAAIVFKQLNLFMNIFVALRYAFLV